MFDTARQLVWFSIVATAACFTIFVVLGNFVTTGAQDQGAVPVRDAISPGVHRLTGIVVLPYSCDELSVDPVKISTTTYDLAFETWQDPSVPCPKTPTPRAFQAVAFAPSYGITFIASLDGTGFPIVVLPDLSSSTQP